MAAEQPRGHGQGHGQGRESSGARRTPASVDAVDAQMEPSREAARKILHLVAGVGAALIAAALPRTVAGVLFAVVAIAAIAIDFARLRVPRVRAAFTRRVGPLFRAPEQERISGATSLACGFALAVILFPTAAAVAGMLYAALADAAAAIVGRRFGRLRLSSGRSVIGSATFFIVATACGILLPGISVPVALVSAGVATIVEVVPWPVDDNLVLPASGAAAVWVAALLLG